MKVVRWEKPTPPTEQEAEARLRQEGHEVFRWHDVPGSIYPKHRHRYDECLWVLTGEMTVTSQETEVVLKAGDRLYLQAAEPHTLNVPDNKGVTYLVGQKGSELSRPG